MQGTLTYGDQNNRTYSVFNVQNEWKELTFLNKDSQGYPYFILNLKTIDKFPGRLQ